MLARLYTYSVPAIVSTPGDHPCEGGLGYCKWGGGTTGVILWEQQTILRLHTD